MSVTGAQTPSATSFATDDAAVPPTAGAAAVVPPPPPPRPAPKRLAREDPKEGSAAWWLVDGERLVRGGRTGCGECGGYGHEGSDECSPKHGWMWIWFSKRSDEVVKIVRKGAS
jgi:hypothetical protein